MIWTDSSGTLHDSGWPACLPGASDVASEVDGLSIAADWLWIRGTGWAHVFWVDCQGR
jgi:hypothetical protein